MRRAAFFLAFAMAITAATAPTRAWAQAADAAVDEDKKKGDEAMVALRYGDALAYYQRAYEANKNPALLYNMGRAYEGLGDFPRALDSLEGFEEKAPPELKARVAKLGELLNDVRKRVATLIVSSNVDGAEIRLGERVLGKTRQGQVVLRVNAGPSHVSISHEGYFPIEKDVLLAGAKVETVDGAMLLKSTTGMLHITSPVTGAQVSVDGAPIGTVPAEWYVGAGSHRVTLKHDGYEPEDTSVIVAAGQQKDLVLPMREKTSITGKWWFWATVGAVVIAGGVASYIAATTEKDPDTGTIQPGRVKAAGLRF